MKVFKSISLHYCNGWFLFQFCIWTQQKQKSCDSSCVYNLKKTTFVHIIAIDNSCLHFLQCPLHWLQQCTLSYDSLYKTCYKLTLWLVEMLSQPEILNMTTECSKIMNYNNSTTPIHYQHHKSPITFVVGRPTDKQTTLWLIELLSQLNSLWTTKILNNYCTKIMDIFYTYYCKWQHKCKMFNLQLLYTLL